MSHPDMPRTRRAPLQLPSLSELAQMLGLCPLPPLHQATEIGRIQMDAREERPVPPGAIVKVVWLDAQFVLDVGERPPPQLVTTVGYELPLRFAPVAHIGIAAEWLGGDEYRAGTFIPERLVVHREVLTPEVEKSAES